MGMEYDVVGARPRDQRASELNSQDAMDRTRRRKLLRTADDQDSCEWVNISSGTGSPRYSWTKGHKTVAVCVMLQKVKLKLNIS